MAEFSAIVSTPRGSHPHSTQLGSPAHSPNGIYRPLSRLARITTPRSPSPPHQDYFPPQPDSPVFPPPNLTTHLPLERPPPPPAVPATEYATQEEVLMQLQEAKSVINHLEGELKDIREMVISMRERDRAAWAARKQGVLTNERLSSHEDAESMRPSAGRHMEPLDDNPAAREIAKVSRQISGLKVQCVQLTSALHRSTCTTSRQGRYQERPRRQRSSQSHSLWRLQGR